MNIKLIVVGKQKEKYLQQAMSEYLKRLSRFANLEVIEIPDKNIPQSASDKQCQQLVAAEGEDILNKIASSQYVIALCVEAPQLSSEQFAKQLSDCGLAGNSAITFIIGGSLGLSEMVKSRADLKLGFSKMTFPHQLMRVILIEQIYRAFKINNNEPYHK